MAESKMVTMVADAECYIFDVYHKPGDEFDVPEDTPIGQAFHKKGTEPLPRKNFDRLADQALAIAATISPDDAKKAVAENEKLKAENQELLKKIVDLEDKPKAESEHGDLEESSHRRRR